MTQQDIDAMKEYREGWRRVIFDATGDYSKALRALELADINGLFDPIAGAGRMRAALEAAKLPHYVCEDDCWYSCPKSGECCDDTADQTKCNCGADAHNAKIDAAIGAGQTPSKET